jgi:hypothetical protein
MVAAAVRTIFAQPDPTHVRDQLDTGVAGAALSVIFCSTVVFTA